MTATTSDRNGALQRFGPDQAKMLYETAMMSMPEMEPAAPEELMEWARSGGHVGQGPLRRSRDRRNELGLVLVWSELRPASSLT